MFIFAMYNQFIHFNFGRTSMKKRMLTLCIMILMLSVYGFALANAAEPPGLTVIVNNPPQGKGDK